MLNRPEYGSIAHYERELDAQYVKYDVIANGVARRLISLAETLKEDHLREVAIQELNTLSFILMSAATGIEIAQADLDRALSKETDNA